jgi:hypothetical protein
MQDAPTIVADDEEAVERTERMAWGYTRSMIGNIVVIC